MKKILITQSNYIPWKGYFDAINMADEMILFDDMQYTKRDWRNRNMIKTAQGPQWLSIPVEVKGKYFQKICDTVISDKDWAKNHWKSISLNYSKSDCFKEFKDEFEDLFLSFHETHLSKINFRFISSINKILGIKTKISWSSEYELLDGKTERLVSICKILGATEYLTGPAAKNYTDEKLFMRENIKITYLNYDHYPEYNQLYPPFTHAVSIIDLIFNEGKNAKHFMKSFSSENILI